MNLELIKKEAESFFRKHHGTVNSDNAMKDVISFAKHCVEKSQQWRPIEEAPSYEVVLVAVEFDCPGDWRIKVGYETKGAWKVWGASWTPTHWQPLPPAPEAA